MTITYEKVKRLQEVLTTCHFLREGEVQETVANLKAAAKEVSDSVWELFPQGAVVLASEFTRLSADNGDNTVAGMFYMARKQVDSLQHWVQVEILQVARAENHALRQGMAKVVSDQVQMRIDAEVQTQVRLQEMRAKVEELERRSAWVSYADVFLRGVKAGTGSPIITKAVYDRACRDYCGPVVDVCLRNLGMSVRADSP